MHTHHISAHLLVFLFFVLARVSSCLILLSRSLFGCATHSVTRRSTVYEIGQSGMSISTDLACSRVLESSLDPLATAVSVCVDSGAALFLRRSRARLLLLPNLLGSSMHVVDTDGRSLLVGWNVQRTRDAHNSCCTN